GKGGVGLELNLDRVPQREAGMSAYEMMLSESQERMLAILVPGREADAQAIFTRWGLDAAVIGRTTETGRIVLTHGGEVVCDLPLAPLTEDAPLYDRPHTAPVLRPRLDVADLSPPADWGQTLLTLIASPDLASRRWIYEQYDRHVMADSLEESDTGADAAVVRVHGTTKAVALTCDCTPRYVAADPYQGGMQAVAEAWRNLCAVGATPLAITDNLNFGNPEKPEIMGQIVAAIAGMSQACRALDFPVVSGNVSLYNETDGEAIPPTPVVGGVGLLADAARRAGYGRLKPGQSLVLLGESRGEIGASLYLREILGREDGAPPPVDLEAEKAAGVLVRDLIGAGLTACVHDLSDGGLAIAAVEMALASRVGLGLAAPEGASALGYLFGEDQGRYLLACDDVEAVRARAAAAGVACAMVGEAGGERVRAAGLFDLPLDRLREAHESWLPAYMSGAAA
ncbi:MAG: phosphoribosylformylglycinamidine synthase II, partial [Alphaproteobacteria bacterium]|nr:phosphoribosylformylglycinamidine synthase II [Alphaproteobacteria bacterium]